MKSRILRAVSSIVVSVAGVSLVGCVERTVRVQTRPSGATILINDEEIGTSPATFSFLWYGEYDIIARKAGYQTLKTHHRLNAPWYQWPPFDLIAETLVPRMITDHHELPVFDLLPADQPTVEELVGRATDMRDRTTFEGE